MKNTLIQKISTFPEFVQQIWTGNDHPSISTIIACGVVFVLSSFCGYSLAVKRMRSAMDSQQTLLHERVESLSIELDEERRRVDKLEREMRGLRHSKEALPPLPPSAATVVPSVRKRRLSQLSMESMVDSADESDTHHHAAFEEILEQLENNEMQEVHAEDLCKRLGVQSLDELDRQFIDDLCEAIAVAQSVHTIDLINQSLEVCQLMLDNMVRLGSEVEHLDLGNCELDQHRQIDFSSPIVQTLSRFIQSSTSIKTLNLSGSGLSGEMIVDALHENRSITTIAVDGSEEIMVTIEQIISRNTAMP